jgi:hypothetical protein
MDSIDHAIAEPGAPGNDTLRFVPVNPAVTGWSGLTPNALHGKNGLETGLREMLWTPRAWYQSLIVISASRRCSVS